MYFDLSIIIATYNTCELTKQCLDALDHSLDATRFKAEVIVIDNKSTDDSRFILPAYKGKNFRLQYIYSEENLGFGRSNNLAVQKSHGTYVLFLNTDCFLAEHSINILMEECIKQKADFIGPQLRNRDYSDQPSCGPLMSLPVIFALLFLKGDHIGLTRYSPQTARQVGWISGACFLCTRNTYDALGGFDQNIFMYMEEVELFTRAHKKKFTVWYTPKTACIHIGSASSNKTFPILQIYKGLLYLHKKHSNVWTFYCVKYMLVLKALVGKYLGHPHYAEALQIALNYAYTT